MAKKLLNKTKKQLIKEIKDKPPSGKRNITFSLPEELIADFKEDCKSEGLTMNEVIEKLMKEFIS